MEFMSTRNHLLAVSFVQAIFDGLAKDQGLYIPTHIPEVDSSILDKLGAMTLHELGVSIMEPYLTDIPANQLQKMVEHALNFPIPLTRLEDNLFLLEVFHGPTLAFKDVGARFMARVLGYYAHTINKKINIIVATSGDTGSAIAHAFHKTPGVDVFILYPSQKISLLQEKQITTFGDNIHALEVEGTFDDCQRLVKKVLSDNHLNQQIELTTSNSINIARLLPQIIYHAWGVTQLIKLGINEKPILSVPSGNLGNLTSAVYARKMGFPIHSFIAAMNINTTFADYLTTHQFTPHQSIKTYANAMDVGNPSNFERLQDFYNNDAASMHDAINAVTIKDASILEEIRLTYERTGQIIDPHTAVGTAAVRKRADLQRPFIITATAHPAKFPEVIKAALNIDITLPDSLARLMSLPKQSVLIPANYQTLLTVINQHN